MENLNSTLQIFDFIKIILGGIIGGSIVAWIEWQRLRRQRSDWARTDQKVDLKVIEAEYTESRWSVESTSNKDEELRIYKSKLDGKLRDWDYLVQVSVTNTTDTELLVLSADLEVSVNIERVEVEKELQRPAFLPFRHTYDLMSKARLSPADFPITIPAKSATGFVFLGGWLFDAPYLVDNPPRTGTFKLQLDDKSEHKLTVPFEETDGLELMYSPSGEDMAWGPHWEKFPPPPPPTPEIDSEDIPF